MIARHIAVTSRRYDSMKGIIPTIGVVIVGLALLVSFGVDFNRTMQNGAVDFRNRITGARLLEHGIDPYHYIWHAGDPAEFCDIRNNPNLTVSKTTVTPTMLVVYAPLAALPYRVAQFMWLFAQWGLLLGTAWLWLRAGATSPKFWLAAVAVTGLTYTPAWRWEAERGQCYTLLIFFFAWWLTATRTAKSANDFAAGCVAGFLVALRPPFIVLLPFLALHRRGQLPGAAVGLLVGVVAPLLLHPPVWVDYFSAMQTDSDYYRNAIYPPRPSDQGFPETIEGTPTSLMGNMASYPFVDVSIYALARRLGFSPLPGLPVMLTFGALFAVWLWWRRRQTVETLLPGIAAWLFLADFFLPTTRWGYYDITIINVVLAEIVMAKKFPWAMVPCLLALPLMWSFLAVSSVPLFLRYLAVSLLALGAILSLFWFRAKGEREPNAGPI
jgi:hypothetical protein